MWLHHCDGRASVSNNVVVSVVLFALRDTLMYGYAGASRIPHIPASVFRLCFEVAKVDGRISTVLMVVIVLSLALGCLATTMTSKAWSYVWLQMRGMAVSRARTCSSPRHHHAGWIEVRLSGERARLLFFLA